MGIAIVSGWSVAERIEPMLSKWAIPLILASVVGARAYYVIANWGYFGGNLSEIPMVWHGGLSIWGAMIIGGIVVAVIHHKFASSTIWGAVATALPLSQAIGRLGNAVNHEFEMRVWLLPWWGAEMVLDIVLFATLCLTPMKYRIWVYVVGYGLIRYFLNPFRQ